MPVKFFIATHKDWPLPQEKDLFVPIGCGGYHPVNGMRDDTAKTISRKNVHYSELTAWYWIWKNIKDVDIVGVCHYRRYFFLHPHHPLFQETKIAFSPTQENIAFVTDPSCAEVVKAALSRADVIVPRREPLKMSVTAHYGKYHLAEDWGLFLKAIEAVAPSLYRHVDLFERLSHAHLYNMMIAPKPYFDNYMGTLFAVMEWMEERRPFRVEPYQCRVPSFLSERFFTLYLYATGARFLEAPIAFTTPLSPAEGDRSTRYPPSSGSGSSNTTNWRSK